MFYSDNRVLFNRGNIHLHFIYNIYKNNILNRNSNLHPPLIYWTTIKYINSYYILYSTYISPINNTRPASLTPARFIANSPNDSPGFPNNVGFRLASSLTMSLNTPVPSRRKYILCDLITFMINTNKICREIFFYNHLWHFFMVYAVLVDNSTILWYIRHLENLPFMECSSSYFYYFFFFFLILPAIFSIREEITLNYLLVMQHWWK